MMYGGVRLFLDLMEIWVRFNFASSIILANPVILCTIGLYLFNKWYRNKYPKKKTKTEQIKGMKNCIENLQSDNVYYRDLVAGLTTAYAMLKIGGDKK